MSTSSYTPDDKHTWCPATAGDSRSPCPALNALANHGYIPHDGRDLTAPQLSQAIQKVYGISRVFATILAYGGVARCGAGGKLNLHDLAAHNLVEHDGSLVHADTSEGQKYAPTNVDPALLRQLLDTSSTGYLSLKDLTQAQVSRQAASPPLHALQSIVSKGELDLIMEVFGIHASETLVPNAEETVHDELVVPKSFLEQWLGEERLPDGWSGPSHQTGLKEIITGVRSISKAESAERPKVL
ncbi:Cloroperoxidase [Trametes versicolor FP-101664 SS1]|uniref:Cloroperoxidase n=1 Tax=Trametes versicolor (strain FP-101664) TaxID=717944 RepID=UPI0004624410|nr:Cloroperoxidase [Trametes versicolor FP-101664 SS1]EIW61336.1 Cloroperoxidase [Trametes versicolor FP-101664 SS1]